ncbi:hypothetical protein F4778DRAFT_518197 [Xylariomycetidae sp. FL2044]|nr:hypothetical protein F4778DRAFT_518197 [Xylariomycetidae sp. FL2044]
MLPASGDVMAKADMEILSQEIWDDEGLYRIRARKRVHYVTIPIYPENPIFDDDTMCQPHLLIPKLPPFPDSDWTKMQVLRDSDNEIQSVISCEPLDEVGSPWHPRHIDVLSLKRISSYNGRVHEVIFEGRRAISKIASFQWWNPQIEYESWVYETLAKDRSEFPDKPPIAPAFLGHLTEQGRRIGFLLEKAQGHFASLVDIKKCEVTLRRLHGIGLVHGDANRYNFVVDASTGDVKMIDFEHADVYDEEKGRVEIEELRAQLTEETGRGASTVTVNGVVMGVSAEPIPYPTSCPESAS